MLQEVESMQNRFQVLKSGLTKEARAKGRHWLVRNVEVLSQAVICFAFWLLLWAQANRFKEKKWRERDNERCILNNFRSHPFVLDHGTLHLLTMFDIYILCGLLGLVGRLSSSLVSPFEFDRFSLIVSAVCCYCSITCYQKNYSKKLKPLINLKSKHLIKTVDPWPHFSDCLRKVTQSCHHISLHYSYIRWLTSFQEAHHLSVNALKCPLNGPIIRLPFCQRDWWSNIFCEMRLHCFRLNWQKPWEVLRAVQVLETIIVLIRLVLWRHSVVLSPKQRQWRGTFQMSWRQSYRIATSMLFLDSTGFDSLPSLPYRAHQIALGKLSFVSHLMIRSPIHHPPPVWVLAPLLFKCTTAYPWPDSYRGEVFFYW